MFDEQGLINFMRKLCFHVFFFSNNSLCQTYFIHERFYLFFVLDHILSLLGTFIVKEMALTFIVWEQVISIPVLWGCQPYFNCEVNAIAVCYCNVCPAGPRVSHDAQPIKVKCQLKLRPITEQRVIPFCLLR